MYTPLRWVMAGSRAGGSHRLLRSHLPRRGRLLAVPAVVQHYFPQSARRGAPSVPRDPPARDALRVPCLADDMEHTPRACTQKEQVSPIARKRDEVPPRLAFGAAYFFVLHDANDGVVGAAHADANQLAQMSNQPVEALIQNAVLGVNAAAFHRQTGRFHR